MESKKKNAPTIDPARRGCLDAIIEHKLNEANHSILNWARNLDVSFVMFYFNKIVW